MCLWRIKKKRLNMLNIIKYPPRLHKPKPNPNPSLVNVEGLINLDIPQIKYCMKTRPGDAKTRLMRI